LGSGLPGDGVGIREDFDLHDQDSQA
jgi:hypothetical protein